MKTLLVGHSTEWSGTGMVGARSQGRFCCCSLHVAVVVTTCADLFYRAWALSALTRLRIPNHSLPPAEFALVMIAVMCAMMATIGMAGLFKGSRDMVLGFFYWSVGAAVLSLMLQAYAFFNAGSDCEWSWDEGLRLPWTRAHPSSYSTEAEFISNCVHSAHFVLGITLVAQSIIRGVLLYQLHAMSVLLKRSGNVDFHTVKQVFTSFARTPTQAAAAAASPAVAMHSFGLSLSSSSLSSLSAAAMAGGGGSSSSPSSASLGASSFVSIGVSAHPPFLNSSSQAAITFSSSSPKAASSAVPAAAASSAASSAAAAAAAPDASPAVVVPAAVAGVTPTLMMASAASPAAAAAPSPRRKLPLSAYSNNVPLPPPLVVKPAASSASVLSAALAASSASAASSSAPIRFGLSSFAPDDGL